ncbi:Plant-drug/metabolite exporter [Trema orientale]|uniref:WAT1-related protein n=1 Tax=Trema orientale TaxID=63057 RepID=A0A2P5EYV0_TREOI|nr:Plant-drug/metabolite exporter [Trema orientale]
MGGFDKYIPAMAMFALQFGYAGVALSTRAALLQGMSPRVFVVYRQAIATLVIAPLAYFTRRKSGGCSMGLRSFTLIFLASLIGVAINQNVYFEGLYLASSTMASAMGNLVPAVTFLIASILGLEKVNIRSLRSIAKILGTILCVSGAMSMALLKGPKLFNAEHLPDNSLFGSGGDNWLLGCVLLFLSCCCWSIWLILQVPASASYPDHLSLSAWMCFMATIQSAIITLFLEKDLEAWKLSTGLELGCCFFSGVIGSGISFFVQAWCVSQRGPLFSAMFNPLGTVIVTILAALFLQEKIYTGGLVGAVGVVIGLYILLWGKAKDIIEVKEEIDPKLQKSTQGKQVDNSLEKESYKIDLEEPLLSDQSSSS